MRSRLPPVVGLCVPGCPRTPLGRDALRRFAQRETRHVRARAASAAVALLIVVLAAACGDDGGTTDVAPSPPPVTGEVVDAKVIFTTNCAGCHTLADAGTTGVVGPNLDETTPPKALVVAGK